MADERSERFHKMTTAPVGSLLVRMSVPTIIGMLVSAVYNITDTFFLGRLGNTVLTAAIGVVFNLMTIIQAIGFMFGHGSGNYMSRRLGRQDYKSASEMAATGFFLSIASGILFAVSGLIFRTPLVKLLGGNASPELMEACMKYTTIILLAVPAMTGTFTLNNQLRLQGSAADGMKTMGIGMLLNIILDPLFIFVFKLDIVGAGLATLIGQYVGMFMLLHATSIHGNISIEISKFSFESKYIKEIFGGGSPNCLRQGITAVSGILLTHAAGQFSDSTITAFTITSRIFGIGFSIILGLGQGFQPVCGYNYGANLFDRVKEAFWTCLKMMSAFLAVLTLILFIFAPYLMKVFEKEDTYVIETGTRILRWQCVSLMFLGAYTLIGMLLQSIGKFFNAAIVSSLRQGICFIPLILLLPWLFGITGVIIVQPVADLLSFAISLYFGRQAFWHIEIKKKFAISV